MSYRSIIIPVVDLDEALIGQMARLYLSHYEGSSEMLFRSDLAEKTEVHLVWAQHEGGEELVGFTSFLFYSVEWRGRPLRVVYTGDTIVHPKHWHQQKLTLSGIAHWGRVWRMAPEIPFYWFLIVKGHRTYKYLHVFFKRFFPHWKENDPTLNMLADHLALARFGPDYDPASGLVRFQVSHGHLGSALAEIDRRELEKPPTRFFLSRNPGYRLGHEMVCVCELSDENMRPLAARIFCDRQITP